jgi:hypothetical protein
MRGVTEVLSGVDAVYQGIDAAWDARLQALGGIHHLNLHGAVV